MIDPSTIPIVAWQQAAIVVLFIVFTGLTYYWRRIERKDATAREDAQRAFQAAESEKWRLFLKDQRESEDKTAGAVTNSISGLAEVITELVQEVRMSRSDFREHDAMERAKLEEMSKTIHAKDEPRTQSRGRGKPAAD
jgi:hypothetical protein